MTPSASTAASSGSTRPRGTALPDNPLAASADPNARRIIAYGQRNPFRFTTRAGTDELWLGDVGWNTWEEINRISDPLGSVENLGWPCYEGAGRQSGYDGANLNICENLYGRSGRGDRAVLRVQPQQSRGGERELSDAVAPRSPASSSRPRRTPTRPNTTAPCSSPTTPATASGPCAGERTASQRLVRSETFVAPAANPVHLETGPGGDLFYVDFDGGTIRRIEYLNHAPAAVAQATPTTGSAPLTVAFDGTGSSDPDQATP